MTAKREPGETRVVCRICNAYMHSQDMSFTGGQEVVLTVCPDCIKKLQWENRR